MTEILNPNEFPIKLNSDNLSENLDVLSRNPHGLVNGVALVGSTCTKWREGDEITKGVEGIINEAGIVTYNPNINEPGAWEINADKYIKAEADAMANFSVLGFFLNNEGLKNMSAGSFTEIGLSILSARLRGQIIAVNIEDKIEETLEDPSILVQFTALNEMLKNLSKIHPERVVLLNGADTTRFSEVLERLVKKQKDPEQALEPFGEKDVNIFLHKKIRRLSHLGDVFITQGGSSGASSRHDEDQFKKDRKRIKYIWKKHKLTDLAARGSKFNTAEYWDYVTEDEEIDIKQKAERLRLLFKSELRDKECADVLLWYIHELSLSLGAVTEIGTLGVEALDSGQVLIMLHEPIDTSEIIKGKLEDQNQEDINLNANSPNEEETHKTLEHYLKTSKKVRLISHENFLRIKALIEDIKTEYGVTIMSFETDYDEFIRECLRTSQELTELKDKLRKAGKYANRNNIVLEYLIGN